MGISGYTSDAHTHWACGQCWQLLLHGHMAVACNRGVSLILDTDLVLPGSKGGISEWQLLDQIPGFLTTSPPLSPLGHTASRPYSMEGN